MADTASLVKERLPINEIIGSYIKIEKAGVNFKARCPFHQEKTPSFFISPSRNTYYCFGCGAKGDVFEFVERIEGLDFLGALKLLAEKAGIPLEEYKGKSKDDREKLFNLIEEATKYFENELSKNLKAIEYLYSRGLTDQTIKQFRIGYSPPSWRGLSSHLAEIGFRDLEIEKAGLSKRSNKGFYDRFRGRIIFPVFDTSGRPTAFSGRIFDTSLEGEGINPAKYVNSPETELYHKSKILYGMNFAKDGIRKWTFAIVVEGQMDLVMSHQAGFHNTIALSGTALTEDQLTLISRFTDKIVLSLDADVAGVTAVGKSATLALSKGFDVKVAHIRGGKDPADIVKENVELWREIIRNSMHIIEYYLSVIGERGYDLRKYRLEVARLVLPFLSNIRNAVDRAHFIGVVARKLQIPDSAVLEELSKQERSVEISIVTKKDQSDLSILTKKERITQSLIGLWKTETDESKKKMIINSLRENMNEAEFEKLTNDDAFINDSAFKSEEEERLTGERQKIEPLMLSLNLESLREKESILRNRIKDIENNGTQDNLKIAMSDYQETVLKIHKIDDDLRKNNFTT